jgi:hypothetical protein
MVDGVVVVILAAVAGFCLYPAIRSCQFFMNPSFQLDDRLKAVKCKILLEDIQDPLKSDADVTALVKEFETLQGSMTKKDRTVLEGLFEHYLKKDPEKAYQIAKGSSSEEMLSAFKFLQKNSTFNDEKLFSLLNKAYEARIASEDQLPPLDAVKGLLEYVRHAHSLNVDELKNKALQRAIDFAVKCEDSLVQVCAWREIAKVCKDLRIDKQVWKETEQFSNFLGQAREASQHPHLQNAAVLFKAHLTFAYVKLLCGENNEIALEAAYTIGCNGFHRDVDLLAELYAELGNVTRAQEVLTMAFNALKGQNTLQTATDYLILAYAFQPNMPNEVKRALNCAIEVIEQLPDISNAEIRLKYNLLIRVGYCATMSGKWKMSQILDDDSKGPNKHVSIDWERAPEEVAQRMLTICKQLYKQCKTNGYTVYQYATARSIFEVSKSEGLKSEKFFKRLLSDLTNSQQHVTNKIIDMTTFAWCLTPDQRTRMLEAAEKLMPQVPSCNFVLITALIAEGYLGVNLAKSRELLDNYTKGQARMHLLNAVTLPIILATLPKYPMVSLAFSAASLMRVVLL